MEIDRNELIEQAKEAMERAYCPYSGFKVGAALLTNEGTIIQGINIESITFTPTVCAERTAFFTAVAQGIREFTAVAVVTEADQPTSPCGVCRQVMAEFVDGDFVIIMTTTSGQTVEKTLDEIFPMRFDKNTPIGNANN